MDHRHAHGPTRRRFLAGAGLAALAAGLPVRLTFADEDRAPGPHATRAGGPLEHLVVLWMAGGPSQIDTFDPKPGRKTGGPFGAIPTAVDGVAVCEHLPQLAKEMADLTLVRGLTSRQGAHERATHLYQTGYEPDATAAHPHVGSWIARQLGDPSTDLPAFVAVGTNEGSGFLGPRHAPFAVADVNRPLANLVPRGVPAERTTRRRALLELLGASFEDRAAAPVVAAQQTARERARRLMASPHAKAFDTSLEGAAVQDAYGKTFVGRACLLARRLVEAGVRVVHVSMGGWDNHRDAFPALKSLCGQLDPAFAQLVRDLRERDLLGRTLVLWMGEFGRTPDINATNGRDHYPQACAAVLAGAGVQGGRVVGRTDEDGRKVVEGALAPPELTATVLSLAGIDLSESHVTAAGRPVWPAPKEAKPLAALLPPGFGAAPAAEHAASS